MVLMDIYEQIDQADKDFGIPLIVDPKANTVVVDFFKPITEEVIHVSLDGDGQIPGPLWEHVEEQFEYDLRRDFNPAEFLNASNWKYWLEQYVEDGIPFKVQTFIIEGIGDDPSMQAPIGWGFAVKVLG